MPASSPSRQLGSISRSCRKSPCKVLRDTSANGDLLLVSLAVFIGKPVLPSCHCAVDCNPLSTQQQHSLENVAAALGIPIVVCAAAGSSKKFVGSIAMWWTRYSRGKSRNWISQSHVLEWRRLASAQHCMACAGHRVVVTSTHRSGRKSCSLQQRALSQRACEKYINTLVTRKTSALAH